MGIKLGNIELKHGLFLAPMAGFTDYSFRKICREYGAEYTVSEMVSAKALCYEQDIKKNDSALFKTAMLATVRSEENPMSIQLFGSESEFIARAAQLIEDQAYKGCRSNAIPSAIDINMGCPMHKIVSNGEGSALMKNPTLVSMIVEKTVKALRNTPVTVKIRAGWDDGSKNAKEVALAAEAGGAALICVHARTKEQMYNPGIDPEIIKQVKEAVKIPVIGNGDVNSVADAIIMMKQTGCDGVMIGRGALGNPWIFDEIAARLDGREYSPPTLDQRLDTVQRHIKIMREHKGEHICSAEIKKHVALYIKGIHGAAEIRDRIMKTRSTEEIEAIINELKTNKN